MASFRPKAVRPRLGRCALGALLHAVATSTMVRKIRFAPLYWTLNKRLPLRMSELQEVSQFLRTNYLDLVLRMKPCMIMRIED
jgi:hypothetical protein